MGYKRLGAIITQVRDTLVIGMLLNDCAGLCPIKIHVKNPNKFDIGTQVSVDYDTVNRETIGITADVDTRHFPLPSVQATSIEEFEKWGILP